MNKYNIWLKPFLLKKSYYSMHNFLKLKNVKTSSKIHFTLRTYILLYIQHTFYTLNSITHIVIGIGSTSTIDKKKKQHSKNMNKSYGFA